jgi:YbbR domain-containing protein
VNTRRTARRVAGIIIDHWPLKVAAAVLASLLYIGLVASQDSATYPGPLKVTPVNQPGGTVVVKELRDVDEIRYVAPAELGRLGAEDFRATVDLSNLRPDANPVNVRVSVTAVDPRVSIADFSPRSIPVVLDQLVPRTVPVTVDMSTPPDGLTVGDVTLTPAEVTVTGPSSLVSQVVSARVGVTIDSSGVNIDREIQANPINLAGEIVTGVDLDPALVQVTIPVYDNLQNRSVPVNPIVTGTPAAGFRIAAVEVDPLVVSVEGDLDQLELLAAADTAPVIVSGATRDVMATVPYALPTGVSPIGAQTATVIVRIEAVTETRTYLAGIRLDGRSADVTYETSEAQVLLSLFGSTAVLDRLGTIPIVISINVADLEPGTHEVAVVPTLTSAVTVAAISPETITVTVTSRPTPEPTPTPPPAPASTPAS